MSHTIDVVASGRLSVEPRVTQSNTSSCIRFAFPRKRKDGDSSWLSIEVWVPNSRVPYLTDRLKKGAVVSVSGSLECEMYQAKERWFVKTNDVTILSNSPDYVSRYGDQQGEHRGEEYGGDPGFPEANGYGAPGGLPVLGEQHFGHPAPNAGYDHPPVPPAHHSYGPPPTHTPPHPAYGAPAGYGHAPTPAPAPGYTAAPRQGYARPAAPGPAPHAGPAPAPRAAPSLAATSQADGTLKF